tara:strand:- start:4562 stop:5356 length:795 start_codon:yes stop_codon:yes gene_type:complete
MRQVILFDMDGTLTLPRKKISIEMIRKLKDLSTYADIGIVTGSGYDYLEQQCKELWFDIGSVPLSKITLLPCNGTQVYSASDKCNKLSLRHKSNMRKEIGADKFDRVMKCLSYMQLLHCCKNPSHALTGHFISYRGSLINWCPVGRNADDNQRNGFIEYDIENKMRLSAKDSIQKYLSAYNIDNISLALGGSTSIDIFPTGWDKTYALNHFQDKLCWFVGDSCDTDGNDKALYDLLKIENRAYKTSGPAETLEIIDRIIEKIKN